MDVLFKKGRCDMFLPIGDDTTDDDDALTELLVSSNILSNTIIAATGGDDIIIYKLSSLISEPRSPRQPFHPDNLYQDIPPLFTVFIALQDINIGMGPASFIP